MTGTAKFFATFLLMGSFAACLGVAGAQATGGTAPAASSGSLIGGGGIHGISDNFVARARESKSWEYGPFANYGFGLGNRSQYKFLWAGFQLGKPLTPVLHAGVFSGQFELAGNIMPLWQAYTPAPHMQPYILYTSDGQPLTCLDTAGQSTLANSRWAAAHIAESA